MTTAAISNLAPHTPSTAPVAATTINNPFAALIGSLLDNAPPDLTTQQPSKDIPIGLPNQGAVNSWLQFVLPLGPQISGLPTKLPKTTLDPHAGTAPGSLAATLPEATGLFTNVTFQQPTAPAQLPVTPTAHISQAPADFSAKPMPLAVAPYPTQQVVTPSGDNLAFAAKLTELTPATPINALEKPAIKGGVALPVTASPGPLSSTDSVPNSDTESLQEALALQKSGQAKPDTGKQDQNKSHEDLPSEAIQEAVVPNEIQHAAVFAAAPEAIKAPPTLAAKPIDTAPPAATILQAPPAAKTQPVRDLSFQIGTGTINQVDVRIQDRSGEVRVAVHSSNPDLTADMRQQLGDLVVKLDRAGYHSETYKPSSETQAAQSSSESSDSTQQDASGEKQQQQEQQSGRQRKDTRPQWLQEMNGEASNPS